MQFIKDLYDSIKCWRRQHIYKYRFLHKNKVKIESDVLINNKFARIEPYTFIGKRVIIGPATESIGKFCSIGSGSVIGPNSHDLKKITTSTIPFLAQTPEDFISKRTSEQSGFYRRYKAELNREKVVIEDDVWIGHNAIIMPNVRISTGAVIGASAVVTKDIGAYCIAVGVPARTIGKRFSEQTISLLLENNLYQRSEDQLLALFHKYANQDLEENLNEFLIDLIQIPLVDRSGL